MTNTDSSIWVYLSTSPLLWLTLTLIVYSAAVQLYQWSKENPLLNPVAISIISLMGILTITKTDYQLYFSGAQYIHFLLGPATVALAIPLYQQLSKLKTIWLSATFAITIGVVVGALSSVFIARWLGADIQTQLSLSPKSVTAPVAMGIAEKINALPSLTAALVVMTGITGALICTKLFSLLGIKDNSVKGIAVGVAAHGIGTARAFQLNAEMGAFSGLAMALSTLISALALPWLVTLLF
ncbi:MAG: putative murein hydrolase (TIGR00659 family) [Cellvibrionaceae bacterium]|jgi:predicted murein hydrolase (TIGR00659 family)